MQLHNWTELPLTLSSMSCPFLSWSTGISDEDIINITLPTGVPILLELDENLHAVGPHQFLGDQEAIQAAIKKIDDQGKVKKRAEKWRLSHLLARNSCERSGMQCLMGADLSPFLFFFPLIFPELGYGVEFI